LQIVSDVLWFETIWMGRRR